MQQLQPLNSLKPLNNLDDRLKPMFERDTRKYYSNLDLVCMCTNLLYESHLLLEKIDIKRGNQELTLHEHYLLNKKANQKIYKAYSILNTIDKSPIFWNDEDIEHDFVNLMLSDVEKC